MKSRRSRSFSGLLCGYPGIYKGPRSRLGKAEDKEGEESEVAEVESALEGALEDSEASNLSLYNQAFVSQYYGENYSIHGTPYSKSYPKSPSIQYSINEGTGLFLRYSSP
ncbi:hypothetical protein O181_005951 [Austropuccinia psidii MF-1]|uniref:Uncharacterized protein n=1 Tax=Austropuccinia psidii MF-1 TaxID=1389203 RepID=A0A9Q3BJV8_9BASI|nr:hypothetical protein [Austropuccinia psidii MF-1]